MSVTTTYIARRQRRKHDGAFLNLRSEKLPVEEYTRSVEKM